MEPLWRFRQGFSFMARRGRPPKATSTTVLDNRHQRFRDWFELARKQSESWRADAKDDYGFVEGHAQWTQAQRAELEKQKRPALTFNNILPTINSISGHERGSRLGVTFKPRGLEDDRISSIANSAYKFAEEQSDLIYEASDAFADMAICGRGWVEMGMDFSDVDEPFGELKPKRRHPLTMFWDPNSSDYNMQDAEYLFQATWVDEDYLRLFFPSGMKDIRPGEWLGTTAAYVGEKELMENWRDTRAKKIRLLRCWYKVKRHAFLLILPDNQVERFDTEEAATSARDALAQTASAAMSEVPDMPILDRVVTDCRSADLVWWRTLRDAPSPYRHRNYPFVPFRAFSFDEIVMGVVRNLKDPQREKNKRWQSMTHMISTMAKNGWKIPKGSVSAEQLSKWETESSKPGFWFEYNHVIGAPEEFTGKPLPTVFIDIAVMSEDEIRKISGAAQELMGIARSPDQSGKAMNVIKQGAVTILAPLFDSLDRSERTLGSQAMSQIQQYYPPEKIYDILGSDVRAQLGDEDQALSMIERAQRLKYDTIIDTAPLLSSERDRQLGVITEWLKIVPSPALLRMGLKMSDFPDKEAAIRELEQPTQGQPEQGAMNG